MESNANSLHPDRFSHQGEGESNPDPVLTRVTGRGTSGSGMNFIPNFVKTSRLGTQSPSPMDAF